MLLNVLVLDGDVERVRALLSVVVLGPRRCIITIASSLWRFNMGGQRRQR